MGLKVIQRNVRKFLQLRFWGWWKLYNKVRAKGPGQWGLLLPVGWGRAQSWTEVPLRRGCKNSLKMRAP